MGEILKEDKILKKIPVQTRLDFQRIRCKKGKDIDTMRSDILSKFRYFTGSELRRHHLPYYIYVLKELDDTKYNKSFEMLLDLLVDNEDAANSDKTGFIQWLTDSNYVLDVLKDTLVRAELAECDKDLVKKCKILSAGAHRILNIGLGKEPESQVSHFDGMGWFWLVLRLLEIALDVAETIKIDGGEREAVQRYMLAKLLLQVFPKDKPERAENILKKARHMSLGMDHWKMDDDEGDKDSTLNSCICLLMADMYIDMGRHLMHEDISECLVVCKKAVKRAEETSSVAKLSEAIIRRGLCYMKMMHFQLALDDFLYVLCVQEKNNDINGICEAHVTLSLIYQELKQIFQARKHLETIVELAATNGLKIWEAIAYWRLGELLIREGIFEESAVNFWKAYQIYSGSKELPPRRTQSAIIHDLLGAGVAQPTPRKTVFGITFGYKSSLKVHINHMREKILNKVGTGFLFIPGPNNLPKRLEYRSLTVSSLPDSDNSRASMTSTSTIQKKTRRSRKMRTLIPYFLDDNDPADEEMNTYLDITNKEELGIIRCQYGIAKAHQYLNIFWEEVEKSIGSQRARHRVMSWKLNKKPFWENRDQSEERFLTEHSAIKVLSSDELILNWTPMELSKHSQQSD